MNNLELRRALREHKESLQIRQAYWLDLLGLIVPLAAPLVPAYLTATAIIEHYPALLHIDKWLVIVMAIIAGAVIEVLGILSIETMFDMRTFNATVQEGDEQAPFEAARAAVGFYLLLVIALVILLKIWPFLALWSLAPLTVLGFITSWVMVLRKQHSERVFKAETTDVEQSEIERLNADIERLINEHQVALNAEQQRLEQQQREHAEQFERERERRLNIEAELNGLREKYDRLAEQATTQRQPQAKAQRKPKMNTKKVDPKRIEDYFIMNPNASVRQAAGDLNCSVGSIQQHKPAVHSANGHSKEVA